MLPVLMAEIMVACWDTDTGTGSNGPHPWDGVVVGQRVLEKHYFHIYLNKGFQP